MGEVLVQSPTGSYVVRVGEGLLTQLGEMLRDAGLSGRAALVTDDIVGPLYATTVTSALEEAGIEVAVVTLPAGEVHKCLESVHWLYERFLDADLDRSGMVITLGGGVIGDMAGFAAATYLRGLPLVQVPTTLLSMVDSSIGGKVGVDLPRGKNLVGAFKQPALVVADTATLSSLPPEDFAAGLAEVVKHGVIGDPVLFGKLETHGPQPINWLLLRAIDVKRRVVEADPYEQGVRAVLNFGHTFGHALETLSGYQMRHGFAVSIGMVLATRLALRLGLCQPDLLDRLSTLLANQGMPTRYAGPTAEQVWAAMAYDKKRQNKRVRFVLPRALGDVILLAEVRATTVLEVLAEGRDE